ncbi:5-formyltetrahydrofolate cyclo-ligase [Paenibacillus sp. J2TS4]|uniref:5-formyltetrahydrofolate cyclo-ligase n=1 Tax=Paenibacillus sp. J2TS4 TaxID=2807194 RepID=UPI001B0E1282|nr:5-formyltetrahydrofolate cyclo-ligase [Paenibacillus sp. J2TS4]GIP35145.1 5-formyltetrahydrofolate cyclo-ligase [Paenibacillus sp. J2TS4]
MMIDRDRKRLLRQQAEARRSALPESERRVKSETICRGAIRYLAEEPALLSGGRALFVYLPFRTELDVSPLMQWGWSRGIPVAVPRTNTLSKEMEPVIISSMEEVELSGPWGIREPKAECPRLQELDQIGCIVMPGLAFDDQRRRLGYGGGYYDRFLAGFERQCLPLPVRIALAFDVQIIPEVPEEKHDYRVDVLITESVMIR